MRSVTIAVTFAMSASLLVGAAPRQTAGTQPDTLLHRAREWAGAAALGRVQSIVVTTHRSTAGEQYRLRLPSQFQTRYYARDASAAFVPEAGFYTRNTLDGNAFWQKSNTPIPAEYADRARRGSTSAFVNISLTFLLRVPPGLKVAMKALGATTIAGLAGDAMVITDPIGKSTVFVFEPRTGALIGYVDNTPADGQIRNPTDHLVVRLEDFREVAGIKFPFRAQERWEASGGATPNTTVREVDSIETNTLATTDFKQVK